MSTPLPKPTGLTGEWYGWLARHELRFQRCADCGRWRHVPRELCPDCGSASWNWDRSSGRGTVFTWSVTHRPLHPAFADTPFAQVVVELAEGPRVLSSVVDVPCDELAIGLPVTVCFHDLTEQVTLPRFRLTPSDPR
jgi:uncharacterized OB-fold protein